MVGLDTVESGSIAQKGGSEGLGELFAAVRTRLGLVVLLLGLAGIAWWATVNQMVGMDAGPGTDLGALGWLSASGW